MGTFFCDCSVNSIPWVLFCLRQSMAKTPQLLLPPRPYLQPKWNTLLVKRSPCMHLRMWTLAQLPVRKEVHTKDGPWSPGHPAHIFRIRPQAPATPQMVWPIVSVQFFSGIYIRQCQPCCQYAEQHSPRQLQWSTNAEWRWSFRNEPGTPGYPRRASESLSGRRYTPASMQLYNKWMAEECAHPPKAILSAESRAYQLPSNLCSPWILCSHPRIPSGPSAPAGTWSSSWNCPNETEMQRSRLVPRDEYPYWAVCPQLRSLCNFWEIS